MPPPPINTGAGQYQAPHPQQMYPQAAAPPGYPMSTQGQQGGGGYGGYQHPNAFNRLAEVEGNNRSKAQLIVGIDFVSDNLSIFGPKKSSFDGYTKLTWVCHSSDLREPPFPVSHSHSQPTRKPRKISLSNGRARVLKQNRR
jgi:hypothetical protein